MNKLSKNESTETRGYLTRGTDAPWYEKREISEAERAIFRKRSKQSLEAKRKAMRGDGNQPKHSINIPKLHPEKLMPKMKSNGIRALSLFSGGGGLDLGFDLAGYDHVASYELLEPACKTLKMNRPDWRVFGGENGDVTSIDWHEYSGKVDLIHGGPPCQPFSMAGRQKGANDVRDMFPEFVRDVLEIKPIVFFAENVPALTSKKFGSYVKNSIMDPLKNDYYILVFRLFADQFGVPQTRQRVFFVGFNDAKAAKHFCPPVATHDSSLLSTNNNKNANHRYSQGHLFKPNNGFQPDQKCMGVRKALGLPSIGFDALSPTLRSTLTGPRHTTSILSSTAAQKLWEKLEIWPNGVQLSREKAQKFPAKNDHFRLSLNDCAVIQGFPESWKFFGAAYMALGQLGNSVSPPVAYNLAVAVAQALS